VCNSDKIVKKFNSDIGVTIYLEIFLYVALESVTIAKRCLNLSPPGSVTAKQPHDSDESLVWNRHLFLTHYIVNSPPFGVLQRHPRESGY
jgi:hypothetical protein